MLEIVEKITIDPSNNADEIIYLDHLIREKGRFKILSESGAEVRVFLERGQLLKEGQGLLSTCGKTVQVAYAKESIVRATADDWQTFVKACYHLGNRHVRLQIGERYLLMTPDHVLEAMIESFGLRVEACETVFVPEIGAYAKGHSHSHSHSHEHADEK